MALSVGFERRPSRFVSQIYHKVGSDSPPPDASAPRLVRVPLSPTRLRCACWGAWPGPLRLLSWIDTATGHSAVCESSLRWQRRRRQSLLCDLRPARRDCDQRSVRRSTRCSYVAVVGARIRRWDRPGGGQSSSPSVRVPRPRTCPLDMCNGSIAPPETTHRRKLGSSAVKCRTRSHSSTVNSVPSAAIG